MLTLCTKCHKEKDESAFRLRKRKGIGHRTSQCKTCEYEARRIWGLAHPDYKRERYAENPEKYREEARTWWANHQEVAVQGQRDRRAANPRYLEEARLATRLWRVKHQEDLSDIYRRWRKNSQARIMLYHRVYNTKYYLAHREEIIARVLAYYQANPAKAKASVHRRRARLRGASGRIETIKHQDIAERDNWICHICHKKVTRKNWSLDHLIPVSAQGEHNKANVALAHRRCNSKRGVGRTIAAQLRLFG